MRSSGLLAVEKTEAILITNRNVRNSMTVTFEGHCFESKPSIKYLGVQIDFRLRFADHAKLASKRASEACRQLSRLLPNARGPGHRTKKILASVITSHLLYGTPMWFGSMTKRDVNRMASVLRCTMLRIANCYSTVSYETAAVVADIPSIRLLAEERVEVQNHRQLEWHFWISGSWNGRCRRKGVGITG